MVIAPDVGFMQNVSGDMNVIQTLLFGALGNFIGLWSIISLVLLLSSIFRNSTISIVVGIILYFAASAVSGILFRVIEKWEWVKWNPLNMLNLSNQMNNAEIGTMTHLSVGQLFVGNILY